MTALLKLWPYLAGAALLIGAYLYVDHRGYQRGAEDMRSEWAAANLAATQKVLKQERANHAESARRFSVQMEAVNANVEELAAARRDAAGAAVSGDKLRTQIGGLIGACRAASNPGFTPSGTAAGTALDMLPDVQRRLDEAANGIARHADEASAAGRACERSYDALNTGGNK